MSKRLVCGCTRDYWEDRAVVVKHGYEISSVMFPKPGEKGDEVCAVCDMFFWYHPEDTIC